MSKKRYNVNKKITRFIFAYHLSSYYLSQTLHLYALSAFKMSSNHFIKVCCFFFFFGKKGFFCLYEKYVFSPVLFLCMIFAEITFYPSINLEQPVMVLVLFSYVSARSRNALPDFIRTYECTGFKRESRPHFVQRLFVQRLFLMNISLNIMYLVCICICYVF